MRSKVIIIISVIILFGLGFIVYKSIVIKSIVDYIDNTEPFYETKIDNYEFYVEEIDDITAINVSNLLALLGVEDNVSVSDTYLSKDINEIDMDRDAIILYADDINFSMPVYTVYTGGIYYVYYDTSGNLHGLHFDEDYNLIEMR